MVLKIFKKKKVPEELPDLATDEIEKKLEATRKKESLDKIEKEIISPSTKERSVEEKKKIEDETFSSEKKVTIEPKIEETKTITESKPIEEEKVKVKETAEKIEVKREFKEEKPKVEIVHEPITTKKHHHESKPSFFKELETSLKEDVKDPADLEKWVNKKILSTDTISEMKLFYEKQKSDRMIEVLGKNYQEKIAEKTAKLQILEKEWQAIYFSLIEVEEKIREEEKVLKKLLFEFMEECRKRKSDIEPIMDRDKFIEFVSDDREDKIIKIR